MQKLTEKLSSNTPQWDKFHGVQSWFCGIDTIDDQIELQSTQPKPVTQQQTEVGDIKDKLDNLIIELESLVNDL